MKARVHPSKCWPYAKLRGPKLSIEHGPQCSRKLGALLLHNSGQPHRLVRSVCPGPGVIVGLVRGALQTKPRSSAVSIQDCLWQYEVPVSFLLFQGSIRAPVILNPAPQVRHLWLTPRLGGRWLWFPHSRIVNSPECGSTNLHFSISRGHCKFPYLHIGHMESHKEVCIMHPIHIGPKVQC